MNLFITIAPYFLLTTILLVVCFSQTADDVHWPVRMGRENFFLPVEGEKKTDLALTVA